MSEFLLMTTPDCHLCGHGRAVLDKLQDEGLLSWREVDADTQEGLELAPSAPPLRPVLFAAGDRAVIACGRLSERRLRRDLTKASVA